MPFGLKNAPAKFQRVMDAELQRAGCTGFAYAYLDDLLVASDTWEEHIVHVRRTLRALEEANLMIHPDKSVFGTNIVEYLGHNVVGQHGITMNEAKVASIRALPVPTNVPELRSILGFLAYYRHFIPGYSSIVAPLNNLLKKDVRWNWGPTEQQAYAALKDCMCEPGRVLRPIDPDRPLILHTDWSIHGIGAVLGQRDDDGHEYLCACISRSLNKHERNYPSYKGELLALAWAIRMFRQHLFGTSFQVVTDHQPLLWIMRARDLNGQYARWQLLLQEYDFNIVHRAGVKHVNADVLSRFPAPSSEDHSGARFDEDVARVVAAIFARREPIRVLAIDEIAPRFADLFRPGLAHVTEHSYMETAFHEPKPRDLDPQVYAEQDRLKAKVVAAVKTMSLASNFPSKISMAIDSAKNLDGWYKRPEYGAGSRTHALDTSVVGPAFYPAAEQEGIVLIELCGGIGAMLEALLQYGVRIKSYYYVDIDPVARDVMRYRLDNFSGRYPDQFPITAHTSAFDLPQDVRQVTRETLRELLPWEPAPYLVTAGWPCQEYSPAGLGHVGERAALLDDVLRVIRYLQERAKRYPVAYVLENVAMQLNFRHWHVRYPVFDELMSRIGRPITFDAVQVGSRAHRVRNFWTNLVEGGRANAVFEHILVPARGPVHDILGHGRVPQEVRVGETSQSGVSVNETGKPRKAFPTFTSYVQSRAFRPGKAGSIWDANRNQWDEPNAMEREAAMGYTIGATQAPGVSDVVRRQMLGQAMDVRALVALWMVCQALCIQGVACRSEALHPMAMAKVATKDALSHLPLARVLMAQASASSDPLIVQADDVNDIWSDQNTMCYLRTGWLPENSAEANRVRKRQRLYRWRNDVLHRFVVDRRTGEPTLRLVPEPSQREALIMAVHSELGHVGEKRTIDALKQLYWWYGLTIDVKRMLSTCKECKRANQAPAHRQLEMQTHSHDSYGMFFRWGLDYTGELMPSQDGNKYALICIDYFTKWIEVIPVSRIDSKTTVREVLLNIIARYGVPAEFVTDNGSPFQGEFLQFMKEKFIKHRPITPNNPRANGLAERAVQTVKLALQKMAAQDKGARNWDTVGLAKILLGYRCTVHAATQVSPAQALFAQDPAIRAEAWIAGGKPLDFDDPKVCSAELLKRSALADDLRLQMVNNLRLAHERNVARFKALRSGLYKPKVHHFMPGDYVFTRHQPEQIPGGGLGLINRDEVLKIVEVRPSGVLVLENKAGKRFTRHCEQCSPCGLTNVEGTVHPDMLVPSWKYPCSVCGDHRHGSKMLLCDGCNLGFHTYCLPQPLDEVPSDEIWLCPQCVDAGVTEQDVRARRDKFIPTERSRPTFELPNASTRERARSLAKKWHGAPVRHVTNTATRYGRVVFTDVTAPNRKWFKIYWADGQVSDHDTRILARLEIVTEDEAPPELIHKPEPVRILVTANPYDAAQTWSLRTKADIIARLTTYMPGDQTPEAVHWVWEAINNRQVLTAMVKHTNKCVPPHQMQMLTSALDFSSCKVILDPYAGVSAVRKGLSVPACSKLVLNDELGGQYAQLRHNPLEPGLYQRVRQAMGSVDAIVMCPPAALADIVLTTALDMANWCVCMLVADDWLCDAWNRVNRPRDAMLERLYREGRLVTIREDVILDRTNVYFSWVCVFASLGTKHFMIQPEFVASLCEGDELIVTYNHVASKQSGRRCAY